MFKKGLQFGPMYDETGTVDLPVNKKKILIMDPELSYKIIGAFIERNIFNMYHGWILGAQARARSGADKKSLTWRNGVSDAVAGDKGEASLEYHCVVDKERVKRGVSSFRIFSDWRDQEDQDLIRATDSGGLGTNSAMIESIPSIERPSLQTLPQQKLVSYSELLEMRPEGALCTRISRPVIEANTTLHIHATTETNANQNTATLNHGDASPVNETTCCGCCVT